MQESIDNLVLNIDDYQVQRSINKKFTSAVYEAQNKKTGKKVSIKCLLSLCSEDDDLKCFLKELNVLSKINLPGVSKIIGYRLPSENNENSEDKDEDEDDVKRNMTRYIIASEYFENGNLEKLNEEYLKSNGSKCDKMNPTVRSKIIFGIASTMKQIHKLHVVHLNLKPSNILLDDKLEPKITDFNIPIRDFSVDLPLPIPLNDFLYKSPELIQLFNEDRSDDLFPSDVYSYAMILYTMFTTKILFDDSRKVSSLYLYHKKISEGESLRRPDQIPDPYWELIKNCWKNDPSERLTFEQITELLKDDKFALHEFGMDTNLDELHEYQNRIDSNK